MHLALPLPIRAMRLQRLPIASSSRLPPISPLPAIHSARHSLHSLHSQISTRSISTTSPSPKSARAPSFSRPGPPPLPAADQAEFEELVKANQTVGTAPQAQQQQVDVGEMEHRDIRRGPRPQFEGEVNPATGEQGGPKTDPFIAGDGDWQFGGRVTDF